jgi:hypothetical protein
MIILRRILRNNWRDPVPGQGRIEDGSPPPRRSEGRVRVSAFSSGNHVVASPLESRGFQTLQGWPSNPGLTDTPQGAFRRLAVAMRKIAFKILRQKLVWVVVSPIAAAFDIGRLSSRPLLNSTDRAQLNVSTSSILVGPRTRPFTNGGPMPLSNPTFAWDFWTAL